MKTYKTSTPEFKDSVEIIETTDTNHADNVTAADIQNFQNTLSNRALLRSLINFVYDSDSESIISALPADFDNGKLTNFHFGCSVPNARSAFSFVLLPIATSVVRSTNPNVTTSTRYTSRNSPPPSFAHKYGKRQIFPTPTALPAAASTKPSEPLKLFFFFAML